MRKTGLGAVFGSRTARDKSIPPHKEGAGMPGLPSSVGETKSGHLLKCFFKSEY